MVRRVATISKLHAASSRFCLQICSPHSADVSEDTGGSPRVVPRHRKSPSPDGSGNEEKSSDGLSTNAAAAAFQNSSAPTDGAPINVQRGIRDVLSVWQQDVVTLTQSCSFFSPVLRTLGGLDSSRRVVEQANAGLPMQDRLTLRQIRQRALIAGPSHLNEALETQQHSEQLEEVISECKKMDDMAEKTLMLEKSHTSSQDLSKLDYDDARLADFEAMTPPEQFYQKSGDLSIISRRRREYEADHAEQLAERQFSADHELPVDPPDEIFNAKHTHQMERFQASTAELEREVEQLKCKCESEGYTLQLYRDHNDDEPLARDLLDAMRKNAASSEPTDLQDLVKEDVDSPDPKDLSTLSLDELAEYANVAFPRGLDIEHIKLSTVEGSATPPVSDGGATNDFIKQWLQQEQISQLER